MRKFIPGIAVLSACMLLAGSGVYVTGSAATENRLESVVKQETDNRRMENPAPQLLKDASVETSAMCLWEHNSSTTENCWLFDSDGEQEIVNYLNGIKLLDTAGNVDADMLKGSMYGIEIGQKDGTFTKFAWCDGYVFLGDGSIYKADIDFDRIKNYSWQEKDKMPLASFPNMYYIAKKDGKWNKNFLEKSKKLKSRGLKVTTKKFDGTKLEVKIKNKTQKEAYYGEYFSIQARIDGKWYAIPVKDDVAFIDIAYIMKAGKSVKKTYDISPYGKLPSGKYRIVIEGASAAFDV